jgi:hypothetical protein
VYPTSTATKSPAQIAKFPTMALKRWRREKAPAAKMMARMTSGISWPNWVCVRPSHYPASALTSTASPTATKSATPTKSIRSPIRRP